jgi:hypothetical protein
MVRITSKAGHHDWSDWIGSPEEHESDGYFADAGNKPLK